jgi:hypothetical protein
MSRSVVESLPPFLKTHQVKAWLEHKADEILVKVDKVKFSELDQWLVEPGTWYMKQESFFQSLALMFKQIMVLLVSGPSRSSNSQKWVYLELSPRNSTEKCIS